MKSFTKFTGTANQELLAVAKLISYDVYKTYMYPGASSSQILKITRVSVVAFGLMMGVLAIILISLGVTLDFVYLFMGIAIGGAAAPIYFCVNWDKATATGAIAGSVTGVSLSLWAFERWAPHVILQAPFAACSHG
jgi:Na+/proline symporter